MKSKGNSACSAMLKCWAIATVLLLLNACGGGGGSAGSGNNTGNSDTTPDTFSFTSVTNSPVNQWVVSNPIVISGINSATRISVQNGEYAVNSGNFTSSSGFVNNGDNVVVRHMASTQNATLTSSTLTIGNLSADFNSTTATSTGTVEASVHIIFPLGKAKTSSNSIRVHGTAHSPQQLASLSVNGIAATISDNNTLSTMPVTPNTSPPPAYSINWYADVPLIANEDNTLAVSITDSAGNSDDNLASVEVSRKFAPSNFSFDAQTNRLFALVEENELVSINLTNNEYSAIGTLETASGLAYAADSGKVFYATAFGNNISLYSTTIETGIVNLVHNFNVPLADDQFTHVTDIIYSDTSQTVYFILMYPANERADYKHELYGFNVNTGTLALVSGDTVGNGPRLESDKILMVNEVLLGFSWERDALISIDPASGNRTLLPIGIPTYNMALAKGETDNIVYTAGFDGIFRIDLATRTVRSISPEASQDIYVTEQIRSLALDALNNRLLLSDSTAGVVLAIDLDTGERSKVLSSGVGEGRYLLMPRRMAIDKENGLVYLLDNYTNASEALLAVDLTTANRSFVVSSDALPKQVANELLLDKVRNRLIIIYSNQILTVDLISKTVNVMKNLSNVDTDGIPAEYLSGGVIDSLNNKLLLSSGKPDNILIEIDLVTHQHVLLPITPVAINSAVSRISDVTVSDDSSKVYLMSQHFGVVHELDRGTGEAKIIANACYDSLGRNLMSVDYGSLNSMIHNPFNNSLLITSGAMLELNLENYSCVVHGNNGGGYMDLGLVNEQQLLTTTQNMLLQLDRFNLQSVVISR